MPVFSPNQVAVITGAASGLGLELAKTAAARGMKLVLADIQEQALETAARELRQSTAVETLCGDVAQAAFVERLGAHTLHAFGVPHLVVNNAGVGLGGFIWEHSVKDWEWLMGVNVMGVAHGVRVFTPMMLAAAQNDSSYQGRVVNTASMAGLLNAPNMGAYNVSKHAVVSLTETLYQDLQLVGQQVSCAVLCPYFVPTGIHRSHQHRPAALNTEAKPTRSQLIAQAMATKAVTSGQVSAADVARLTFEALDAGRFYIFSHDFGPRLAKVRFDDVLAARNPSDPFGDKLEVGATLRAALTQTQTA